MPHFVRLRPTGIELWVESELRTSNAYDIADRTDSSMLCVSAALSKRTAFSDGERWRSSFPSETSFSVVHLRNGHCFFVIRDASECRGTHLFST